MLHVKNLSVTFAPGTVNAYKALRGIDLHLDPGDFVTILGSNGAGKSTLFNALCGSVPIDSGSIVLGGEKISGMPDYKRALRIGRLYQDPLKGTAPDMTIAENLALAYARGRKPLFARAVTRAERARFADALSAFGMGLEDRMNVKVGLLSGGQRQAMTLLMSTIAAPKLLLLDEHTAALDPATAKTVLSITERIVCEQKLTTLMITHNMRDALRLGNRTIMMNAGRIVLDIRDPQRKDMQLDDLLALYSSKSGAEFDNDRVLLSR